MKKTLTILSFLILGLGQKAAACNCFFIPNFCEAITYQNNGQIHDFLTIQRIKVLSLGTNGLVVGVSKTFFGENLVGQSLFLRDGNGADCGLFASTNLQLGEEYIVASYKDNGEIMLSECYVSFLKIENETVVGAIAPGITAVAVADFPGIGNCGNLGPTAVKGPIASRNFVVTPTLATDMVTIQAKASPNLQRAELKLTVFDVTGRVVFQKKYADFGFYTPAIIDTQTWGAGVYFLQLQAGDERATVKMMKV